MRTKNIKPGDILVHGTRKQIQSAPGGDRVIALAVGNYVEIRQPCGWAVQAHPKASRKVVIAKQARDGIWEPRTVNSSTVEDLEIWLLRNNVIVEAEKHDRLHEVEGRAILGEIGRLLCEEMSSWILTTDDIQFRTPTTWNVERNGSRSQAWVQVNAERFEQRLRVTDPELAEKYDELVDAWVEWRKLPIPSACDVR